MTRYVSLTSAQKETVSSIEKFSEKEGKSPTLTELRELLKLRSLRSVTQRIEILERKGIIRRDKFRHRSIRLIDTFGSRLTDADFIRVPVIASAGCDAVDVFAEQEFSEYIMVDRSLIGARSKQTNIAAIRAIGDSMLDAGIHNGDYVIVEVTEEAEAGDRVVAILGNMAVIKRYDRTDDVVYLKPENRSGAYEPIIVRQEDSRIFGKVMSVIPGTEWVDDIRVEYYSEYGPQQV
jgi:repressor LexA